MKTKKKLTKKPAKKSIKQDIALFIPITNLTGIWGPGEFKSLPANKVFELIIDYPFGGACKHKFSIKTGRKGLGLIGLLIEIGKAYEKIYEDPDRYGVFGYDIEDLSLEGLEVNMTKKIISLSIGS